MFGIIYSAIIGIAGLISWAKNESDNVHLKEQARKRNQEAEDNWRVPDGVYTAYHGGKSNYYRFNDGKKVMHQRINGELCEVEVGSCGKVSRNLTEEQRILDWEKNRKNVDDETIAVRCGYGQTCYGYNNVGYPEYINRGVQYRDVKTGQIYYIVQLDIYEEENINKTKAELRQTYNKRKYYGLQKFYMTEQGKLQCVSDEQIKSNEEYRKNGGNIVGLLPPPEEDVQKFIEFFNSMQRGRNGGYNKFIRNDIADNHKGTEDIYWKSYYYGY